MGRFKRGRAQWKERRVAVDKRHRWPVVSRNGVVVGSVELDGSAGAYVALDISGRPLARKFATLFDARQAVLAQRSD